MASPRVTALQKGDCVMAATLAGIAATPCFEMGSCLGLLLSHRAVTAIQPPEKTDAHPRPVLL